VIVERVDLKEPIFKIKFAFLPKWAEYKRYVWLERYIAEYESYVEFFGIKFWFSPHCWTRESKVYKAIYKHYLK